MYEHIMNREYFTLVFGHIKDNSSYHRYAVESGRRLGKTTALINALPSGRKCIIVVCNMHVRRHIDWLIRQNRPDINIDDDVIFVASGPNITHIREVFYNTDAYINSKLLKYPIFVDNSVLDTVLINQLRSIENLKDERK